MASSKEEFGITKDQLIALNDEATMEKLQEMGGVPGICKALGVESEKGIAGSDEDLANRTAAFGQNTYPPPPSKTWLMFAWEAAQDRTLIILMFCGLIALVTGLVSHIEEGWYDGVAIFFAVLSVIVVIATSDYMQSRQFRGLNAQKADIQLSVVRGGRTQTVSIFKLVVGDVVPLAIGDQVPADGLVLTSHSLTIDESSMTGESEPLEKGADAPFLLSGCKVLDGVGKMLVTAVGMNTEWGKVMATLNQDEHDLTPLQVRTGSLATNMTKLGVSVATLTLVVMLIRWGVDYTPAPASQVVAEVTDILIIAITIVVVSIPEGLPLSVTLTQFFSMRKMMKDNALVRRLSACETMGSATTICSDKTGTLTLNQMTAVQELVGLELRECGTGTAPGGLLWECLSEGIAQNGNSAVFVHEDGSTEVTGSPTEAAIIQWALTLGLDFNATKGESTVVAMETFNSAKKKGGVTVTKANGVTRAHWKGAAEILAGHCSTWMRADGSVATLDEEMRTKVLESVSTMAASSLRCVAVACRDLPPYDAGAEGTEAQKGGVPEADLCLLAILGIKDPCRPGVPDAVGICQRAGVKVRMVTGDNVLTARAIASECGILTPNGVVIEGKDFRVMPEEQMKEIIPRIDVMARSSPTDKHLLVTMLRHMGDVVAVTGDGTNDAPALKEADIGLSMGIAGTEVAKESSDIVILDDNFTTIVGVVRWGRNVFANLQKFIQFQITVNIGALVIDFVAACTTGYHVPLTAVQLLWVNLIMNTMAALALATEPPTPELLKQQPVGRTAPFITNIMWRNILLVAVYQICLLLTLFFDGISLLGLQNEADPEGVRNTIIFNSFVFCQLFNEINCRKPNRFNVFAGLFNNPLFLGVLFVSAGLQVVMVEVLNSFASTVKLSANRWAFCIVVGFIVLPLGFLIKLIPVPQKPFLEIIFPKKWVQTGLVPSKRRGSRRGSSRGGSSQGAEASGAATPADTGAGEAVAEGSPGVSTSAGAVSSVGASGVGSSGGAGSQEPAATLNGITEEGREVSRP